MLSEYCLIELLANRYVLIFLPYNNPYLNPYLNPYPINPYLNTYLNPYLNPLQTNSMLCFNSIVFANHCLICYSSKVIK